MLTRLPLSVRFPPPTVRVAPATTLVFVHPAGSVVPENSFPPVGARPTSPSPVWITAVLDWVPAVKSATEVSVSVTLVGAAAVVNDHVTGAAIRLPAVSRTPLIVAVYVVDAANAADGVNVAVFEPALYADVPATGVEPAANEKPTVAACTASENVAVGSTPKSRHPSHPPPASTPSPSEASCPPAAHRC